MSSNELPTSFDRLSAGYAGVLAPVGEYLLELADRDRQSPAYGCFFYPYWRSKSAGYINARCQEASYSLALLYSRNYPGNRLNGAIETLELAKAGMLFWTKIQHRDGSFDEWYSGEHGFAATAFSAFAISRAFALLRKDFSPIEGEILLRSLRRAGKWLSRRDDLAKVNHEAVSAAALFSLAGTVGETEFKLAAAAKVEKILALQTAEGWFPELGGVDTGYCFLTVEYLCHCLTAHADDRVRSAVARALDFLLFFVHPDVTTGREYNLCRNSYVSMLAAGVMSAFHPGARRLFLAAAAGENIWRQLVQDDLSRCYHLYNGLLAYDHACENRTFFQQDQATLPCRGDDFTRYFSEAGLLAKKSRGYYLVASTRHGGGLKIYALSGPVFAAITDWTYTIGAGDLSCWRPLLSPTAETSYGDDQLECKAMFFRSRYFYPPVFLRLLLDLAGIVPGAWALIKWVTDHFRKKKKASLQLAAFSTGGGRGSCRRLLELGRDQVRVFDTLLMNGDFSVKYCRVEVEKTEGGLVLDRPLAGMEEELVSRLKALSRVEVEKIYAVDASGLTVSRKIIKQG